MGRPRLPECPCDYCFYIFECDSIPQSSCKMFQPGCSWGNYLSRAHWRMVRVKKLIAVGEKCEVCGTTKALQVHHASYENLFHESLDDLQVLCNKCHARIRMESYRNRRMTSGSTSPSACDAQLVSAYDQAANQLRGGRGIRIAPEEVDD